MIPLKDENPTRTFSFLTILLIFVNSAIFIYQLSLGNMADTFVIRMALVPSEIYHAQAASTYLTFLTSMFFHANLVHLGGNMLYLWIFGNNIEDALGHFRFLSFYLICGLAGSCLHILIARDSSLPTIGASGAISGILGAYILLYPKAKIITLVPTFGFIKLVKIPAFFFLGFWFLLQLLYGLPQLSGTSTEGGVAWFGHIGGFLAGLTLTPFFKKNRASQKCRP